MSILSERAKLTGQSDETLAEASQQGDKTALSVLIARHRRLAETAAAGYRGAFPERDDLVQEGMLALLSAAYTYAPDKSASFKTYAGVCVRNRLRSVLKEASAQKNAPLSDYVPLDGLEISGGSEPEGEVISAEETKALFRLFDTELSGLEKQVLICRLKGLSYAETARQLRISPKSADNALQRVRAKLKKA